MYSINRTNEAASAQIIRGQTGNSLNAVACAALASSRGLDLLSRHETSSKKGRFLFTGTGVTHVP